MKRIAINGAGRIGRLVLRSWLKSKHQDIEIVAINNLGNIKNTAHLIKYDSNHGKLDDVTFNNQHILIGNKSIKYLSERDPKKLPWKALAIDIVIEATGIFRSVEQASYHVQAGAKKVIITAPGSDPMPTIVLGINEDTITQDANIISNASCTTNCLAPMVKVLDDLAGISHGFMSTVHSFTADQLLQDSNHSDLRRARAASVSVIPTSTGAASAVGKVLPHLEGKLNGGSFRIPLAVGSVTDFVCKTNKKVSVEQINQAFKLASQNALKGYLSYESDPIVSVDIVGNPHSCIFDSQLTMVIGDLVKVIGWYDNEWGYSNRVIELSNILKL